MSLSLPRTICHDQRPVFIPGMPRSGTSLLTQIIFSDSNVSGEGKPDEIKYLAKVMFYEKRPGCLPVQTVDQKTLDSLADCYLDTIGQLEGVSRVAHEMPKSFLWLRFIWQLFPQTRAIHCRRDPRDTCLSNYLQQFTRSHADASNWMILHFIITSTSA